jgi:hypothetical protein
MTPWQFWFEQVGWKGGSPSVDRRWHAGNRADRRSDVRSRGSRAPRGIRCRIKTFDFLNIYGEQLKQMKEFAQSQLEARRERRASASMEHVSLGKPLLCACAQY